MKKLVVAVGAVAVLTVSGVMVASSGAQAPGPQTLVLKQGNGREKFIDHPPKSKGGRASTGDALVLSNSLTGSKNGSIQAVCTVVVGGQHPAFLCQGVAHLSDGDLLLEARFNDRAEATVVSGVITGGTGAYANARGTFVSKGEPSTDTFTFTTS